MAPHIRDINRFPALEREYLQAINSARMSNCQDCSQSDIVRLYTTKVAKQTSLTSLPVASRRRRR